MASFDYRLNPLYAIKECSSCGALYTRNCGCSKGSLEDKILVPVPDLSQWCHTQMSLWIISRGVVLLILLMEYK
ncbi:hypothetical protein Tco_0166624, partial [Tanacetum coccineum]